MASVNWAALGGFRFEGHAESDPFFGGVLSSLTGWRGLPGARGDSASIPGGNGAFDRQVLLREGRSMELRGGIVAETPSAAAQLQDALEDAVAGGPVLLQVSDATGVWERSVEVLNLTVDGRWIDSRYALTVDLYAPDPIRYRSATQVGPVGLPSHTGGLELPEAFPWHFGFEERAVALVENVGKLPVYPLARVVGSASAVSVHGGPRVLSFEEFSGELVFDSALRRAYLNGSDVTRRLTSRNWHEVPPLESQGFYLRAAAASSETTLTVEYRIGAW